MTDVLTPERILEFLLLDAEFPHSLRFSIDALQQALAAIDRTSGGSRSEYSADVAALSHKAAGSTDGVSAWTASGRAVFSSSACTSTTAWATSMRPLPAHSTR